MQQSKVSCLDCSNYTSCSQQTRMFVNYCGPRIENLKTKIDQAFSECRTRRAHIFKYEVLSPLKDRLRTT